MSNDKLQNILNWLNEQIRYANETINESKRTQNYGREIQYEGVRDALMRCLNKLTN
jgi:hypothetical protein